MSKIIFTVLTALFVAQDSCSALAVQPRLATRGGALEFATRRLNGTIDFLVHYQEKFPIEGNEKLDAFLNKTKQMISRVIEKNLQCIDNKIGDTNSTRSNAQACKTTAQVELKNAEEEVLPQLEECVEDNKPDWTPLLAETTEIIAQGEKILNDILLTEKMCLDDVDPQDECIGKTYRIQKAVGSYSATAGKLQKKVLEITDNGWQAARNCSKGPLETFQADRKVVEDKAISCIESTQLPGLN